MYEVHIERRAVKELEKIDEHIDFALATIASFIRWRDILFSSSQSDTEKTPIDKLYDTMEASLDYSESKVA